jgi:hypothetical protein
MFQERNYFVLIIIVVTLLVSGYLYFKPVTAEGIVDHKAITGIQSSTSKTIVTFTDTDNHVKDPEFKDDFASTTIDENLAHKLQSWYTDVKYVISVRNDAGTLAYFTTREDFNKADVGDMIRFKISRFRITTIEIVKILK